MTHTFHLVITQHGIELWECAICGRRVLMEWPPQYRKSEMIRGDRDVHHTASKRAPGGYAGVEVRS